MTDLTPLPLLEEVRRLIDAARERAAAAVNAELTMLYWQVGRCIHAEVLRGARAEYGQQVIASLARQLTTDYGRGWSEQQLRHCLRVAEVFPDENILSAVRRELSWTHLKTLVYISGVLERYIRHGRRGRALVSSARVEQVRTEIATLGSEPRDVRVERVRLVRPVQGSV